ncbi:hypothetical protein JCM8547_003597 [Rhodosporidiobolus lusitaniae]
MDTWEDADPLFQRLLFSAVPLQDGGTLLVKLVHSPNLALMATDLSTVLFESLNDRKVNRRIEDALAKQGGTGGVIVGIGEDGERLRDETVKKLVEAVEGGKAKAKMVEEGYETLVTFLLPSGLSFEFICDSLDRRSAGVLATHLIMPLLGVTSSLLGLLSAAGDEEALCRNIEAAVDSSGRVERKDEGRAATRFMQVGGSSLVTRWLQNSLGAREDSLQPVALSLHSRPFSPAPSRSAHTSPTKRKPSQSPSADANPPRKLSHAPSSPSKPFPSIAQRMLDHHGGEVGEKVGWEDTQSVGSSSGKGKERATVSPASGGPADQSMYDEEPSTDMEDEGFLPPPQQRIQPPSSPLFASTRLSPSPTLQPSTSRERSPSRLSPLPATGESAFVASPDPYSQLSQPARTPSPALGGGEDEEEDEEAEAGGGNKSKKKTEDKEAKKKQEAKEELARRKARLAKMAAAKAAPAKKKAVKKL